MSFSLFFDLAPIRSTENQDERTIKEIRLNNQRSHLESTQSEEARYNHRAKKYCSTMIYQDNDSKKSREVKDNIDFPFLAHFERLRKEND